MSGPVKRGPDATNLRYGTSTEAQCISDASTSKRQRQQSTIPCSKPLGAQQDTLFSNTSGFYDRQSEFTEPNYAVLGQDNSHWNSELHTSIANLPLSYTGHDHSVAANAQFSAVLDPNFQYEEIGTSQAGFKMTTESGHLSDLTVSDKGFPNNLLSNEIESFNFFDTPSLWSHIPHGPRTSLLSDDLHEAKNESDWLKLLLDEAAKSPSKSNTSSVTDAIFYQDITFTGVDPKTGPILRPHLQIIDVQPQSISTSLMFEQDPVHFNSPFQNKRRPERTILPSNSLGSQLTLHNSRHSKTQNTGCLNPQGRPKLGRSKPLDPKAAKEAAQMRKVIACLRCRAMKLKCSPGEICEKCKILPLHNSPCMRFHLVSFTNYFFPSIVNYSFEDSVVEKFVHENVSGFSGNQVAVEISSGPTYRPISLFINEFQPVDEDFLALSQIKTDEDGNLSSEFTRQYAPPFALPPSSSIALREKCLEHVELIAKGSRNDGELSKKHTSIISWDLFNAIAQYQKSVNNKLVEEAIVLYAMHYFMAQSLVFTDDSADAAITCLTRPTKLPYKRTLTSKLITLQIKRVMHTLVRAKTAELLEGLQTTMSANERPSKSKWASSFCAISILCMCAEMVQSATDLKTVHMMTQEGYSKLSRAKSMEKCREVPIFYFIFQFHCTFRSFQRTGIRKNERGFNPIRDGLNVDNRKDMDGPIAALVDDVLRILVKHESEIGDRVWEPSLDYNSDDLSDLLARHLVFREKNSGKLVLCFEVRRRP